MKKTDKFERRAKVITAIFLCTFLLISFNVPVFASGEEIITTKFDTVKNIVAAIVTAIGGLVTLWGIFEFGNAMQTQEGGAQSQALKRIGGGLVMIVASQLVTLLV